MSRCGSKEAFTNFISSASAATQPFNLEEQSCPSRSGSTAQVDPHSSRGRPRRTPDCASDLGSRSEPDRSIVGLGRATRYRAGVGIESAAGLGRLLAQQLVVAGERVIDVPPTLAARVRLLASSRPRRTIQRCIVDGDRRATSLRPASCPTRRPHRDLATARRQASRPHRSAHSGRVSSARDVP